LTAPGDAAAISNRERRDAEIGLVQTQFTSRGQAVCIALDDDRDLLLALDSLQRHGHTHDGLRPGTGRRRGSQRDGGKMLPVEHLGAQHVVARASPRVVRNRRSELQARRGTRCRQVHLEAVDRQGQLKGRVRRRIAEPDRARFVG
jgi:hypothetical protein